MKLDSPDSPTPLLDGRIALSVRKLMMQGSVAAFMGILLFTPWVSHSIASSFGAVKVPVPGLTDAMARLSVWEKGNLGPWAVILGGMSLLPFFLIRLNLPRNGWKAILMATGMLCLILLIGDLLPLATLHGLVAEK